MDTPFFCVYNPGRRVFLSSKVTVADAINQPLKVLKDLVALETGSSGLWLNPLHHKPSLPKLFPFDLVYLDKDLRIVELMEVIPGLDLPEYRREVTSAVVLPSDTLRSCETRVGDRLIVCPREEMEERIAIGGASVEVLVEPRTEPMRQKEEPSSSSDAAAQPASDADLERVNGSASIGSNSLSRLQPAAVASTGSPEPIKLPQGERVKSPGVSITEVVIEGSHDHGSQAKQNVEVGSGLEDLFANWVDSPSAPPSWIAQKAREREGDALPPTKKSDAPPSGEGRSKRDAGRQATQPTASSVTPQAKEPAPAPIPQAKEPAPAPPPVASVSRPSAVPNRGAPVQIPQRAQSTTFTIGQHGIWQLNTPTTVSPAKRPASNGAGQVPPKAPSGTKRSSKTEGQTPARRTGVVRPPAAQNAQPGDVAPATKPAAVSDSARSAENPKEIKRETKERTIDSAPQVPSIEIVRPKVEFAAMPAPVSRSRQIEGSEPEKRTDAVQVEAEKVQRAKQEHAGPQSGASDFAARIQEKLDRLQTSGPGASSAVTRKTPPAEKKLFSPTPQPAVKAIPQETGAPKSVAQREIKAVSEQQRERTLTLPLPSFLRPKPQQKAKLNNPAQRVAADAKNRAPSEPGFGARLKRWLSPPQSTKSDRRRALRRYVPGMVAHYYTGGAPKPHQVADISMSGFYLLTDDRWVPETMIRMTLQKPCARGERKQSITVLARIVRRGSDGIAAEFVMPESINPNSRDVLPAQATDRFSLARFL